MDRRWPLAALAAALTFTIAPAAFGAGGDPPAAAGWHGREIREPLPQRVSSAVARFPRGWSAGSVGTGSGYATPNGSRRVREVQRRLVRRGYRPGRIDGRFGARTRAAVLWFQIKHSLPRTGRVDARNVATLRQTPSARTPASGPTTRSSSATRKQAGTVAGRSVAATPERATSWWLLVLAAAIMVALAVVVGWRAVWRQRPTGAAIGGVQRRARLTAVAPPPAHAPVDVVGYITVARGADRDRALDTATRSIGSWCEGRGWQLTHIVHDVEPASGRITDRPGLAYALRQIAAGRVAGLVLTDLGDLTRSASELARLLQWLNAAEAFMIALDYELDPSPAADHLAAGALTEVKDRERAGITLRPPAVPAATPRVPPPGRTNHAPRRWDEPT